MSEAIAFIGSLLLCYTGLTILCLAMGRHQGQIFKQHLSERMTFGLRTGGWMFLALSFVCASASIRPSVAAVTWVALVPVAALVLIALISYAPRTIACSGLSAATVGIALMAWTVQV